MRRFKKFADFLRAKLGGRRDAMHARLAEYLGVHPSQISTYKDGQSPSLSRCLQIARFFGEPPERIVALVDKTAEWRQLRAIVAGDIASTGEAEPSPARLPLVGTAQADGVELAFDYTDQGFPPGAADEFLSAPAELADPNAYALLIRGDGMEPLLREGDRVVVSPAQPFVPRRLHVVRARDGRAWLRLVERHGDTYSLLSINPAYPPVYLHADDLAWLHSVTSIRFR